jgi:superfamily II DNA/RNA helicase
MHAIVCLAAPHDAPELWLQAFSDLRKKRRFYAKLLDNVAACGFTEPTPVQRQAIPLLMARRELLAVAPTGAGCCAME